MNDAASVGKFLRGSDLVVAAAADFGALTRSLLGSDTATVQAASTTVLDFGSCSRELHGVEIVTVVALDVASVATGRLGAEHPWIGVSDFGTLARGRLGFDIVTQLPLVIVPYPVGCWTKTTPHWIATASSSSGLVATSKNSTHLQTAASDQESAVALTTTSKALEVT